MICGYYYHFKDIGFKYQPYICNECRDFSVTVMNLSDFFILNIKGMIIGSIFLVLIKKKL